MEVFYQYQLKKKKKATLGAVSPVEQRANLGTF